MRAKLSQWHIDRMRHLREVRGLDFEAIGWLYGRRSAEEVQAILAAPALPVQKQRCSRENRYIARKERRHNVRGKRIPAELVAEMHALHLAGMGLAEIGERYGRSNATIRDLFLSRGLPMQKCPRRPYKQRKPRPLGIFRTDSALVAEMHELYLSGLSTVEIGRRYQRSPSTVGGLFKARGLQYPIARNYPKVMPKRIPAAEIDAMFAFYQLGHSLADVGRKFGRSGKQVGHIFRDRGLPLRQVGRPPANGRRADGTFETYTPATEEEITAEIEKLTRVCIPDRLRLDWRKWSLARRGEFIARVRAKIQSPRERPSGPFSANVVPFDYTTPEARAIADAEAIAAGRTTSRICPSKIKLTSQGVIWKGQLWFWVVRTGYMAGTWHPETGRPSLHRAIWEDFHGRPKPDGLVIRHADGNPNNLDPANLILGDRNALARENQAAALARKSRERLSAILGQHQNPESHELTRKLLRTA